MSLRSLLAHVPGAYTARDWLRYLRFRQDFTRFRTLSGSASRFPVRWANRYPCLDDATADTGFDRHYVYHPAWAARVLAETRPSEHIDISSTLHFCATVSAFLPMKFYDYRPAAMNLSGLTSDRADLLALPFADRSVSSLSCMHVVEHIGLGRYGDPLDPEADVKAMAELRRVIAPGGTLLFVTPVGKPALRFNAHRIYAASSIREAFAELELVEFALVPDDPLAGLVRNAPLEFADAQEYGCGCFRFRRPQGFGGSS